jgi:hypothetical protein
MSGWAVTVIREVAMTEGAGDNNPRPFVHLQREAPMFRAFARRGF